MKVALEAMEAQLTRWNSKIDNLAAKTQAVGAKAGFDALMYVDELKALRAIAQSKLDAFKAAGGARQVRLEVEMMRAWGELDTAFRNPKPPPAARSRSRHGSPNPPGSGKT